MILHLVTDRRRLAGADAPWPDQRACLLEQIRFAVEAGIDVVQVRERDLEAAVLLSLVEAAVSLARGASTRIVVNDRLDVAIAAGAHGVHLREDSMPPHRVRRMVPPAFLIGRSVHDEAAVDALGSDVDYVVAGAVWPTASKLPGHALLGLEGLAGCARRTAVPVVAIGGVTVDRVALAGAAGAAGVAAIGLFIADRRSTDKDFRCGAKPLHEIARHLLAAAGPDSRHTT